MRPSPRLTYEELLAEVRRLDNARKLRLLEELAAMARRGVEDCPERSVLELRGLGKEVWQELDAGEYVERERASWGG
jgi:hypothetical protein